MVVNHCYQNIFVYFQAYRLCAVGKKYNNNYLITIIIIISKSDDLKLAAAVTSKIEAGNFHAAIWLICSENKPAPFTADTYEALKKKHPPVPDDHREPCDPTGNSRFQVLQVSLEDATRSLKTFPAGSFGGPDGITLRHILDMLAGTSDGKLISSLTDFVNLLLTGKLPLPVREIIFGRRLIALQKKDGGIRPIAVGYTLRHLAKCANKHIIERRSNELSPFHVGVGVAGGAEAAVHAIRRLTDEGHHLGYSGRQGTGNIQVCVSISLLRVKVSFRTLHHLVGEGSQQGDSLSALE